MPKSQIECSISGEPVTIFTIFFSLKEVINFAIHIPMTLCPKPVKINVDLSPLCLCLIPSKLIWLSVQSCQNKYGLIAESASASHGAPRLLSSPAVCSQGRGLDHKLQICTEDVQIYFFLLQFEALFLNFNVLIPSDRVQSVLAFYPASPRHHFWKLCMRAA